MESAIYTGWVQHRRHRPHRHRLRYRVFMMLLDLSELDRVFAGTRWWSTARWAPACFRREDFFGDPSLSLDEAVRRRVAEEVGRRPQGPIRMLANLRYFGYIMNPLTCYYCFNLEGHLEYVVTEVTNTPWKERHSYVLTCEPQSRVQRKEIDKQFHVSPFNPMHMTYRWWYRQPDESLRMHIQNWARQEGVRTLDFDATLILRREEITPRRLNQLLWRYPLMTLKVVAAIYWEALKLFARRTPFYSHPGTQPEGWRFKQNKA